jgi:hypothetical protein
MNNEKSVRTTVEIPYTLYKDIRVFAAKQGIGLGMLYTKLMIAGAAKNRIQPEKLCGKQHPVKT